MDNVVFTMDSGKMRNKLLNRGDIYYADRGKDIDCGMAPGE